MKWLFSFTVLLLLTACERNATKKRHINTNNSNTATVITYSYTILYVENVERSIQFYKEAFGFSQKLLTPDKDYGEVNTGTTTLSFANFQLADTNLSKGYQKSTLNTKPFGIEIAFATEDVATAVNTAIAAGGTLEEKPKTKPWGQVVAYVRDIDGFLIEICTPLK